MLIDHYYFKLGISPGEPAERIRQVFREQVNLYHPERLGSTRLRFFEKLGQAYHALSNPERRPEYDHARSDTEPDRYAKPAQVGPVAGGLRGLPRISPTLPVRVIFSASIFEVALARASRNLVTGTIEEAISPEGLDLQVVISPAAALAGGVLKLDVPSCSPCSQCGGAGRQGRFPCEVCDGEGFKARRGGARNCAGKCRRSHTDQSSTTRPRSAQFLSLRAHSNRRSNRRNRA